MNNAGQRENQHPPITTTNQPNFYDKLMQNLNNCPDYNQYLQIINEDSMEGALKKYLSEHVNKGQRIDVKLFIRDQQFYSCVKQFAASHQKLAAFLCKNKDGTNFTPLHQQPKNQSQSQGANNRKATRSFYAMKNQKKQEELKKDQIFVRMIPRSQTCIQFMLNNRNFPRMQLKLSCNQHIEYLVNYLTNKWLRGKVGVGYQIVLYPDPSWYLKKNQGGEQMRTDVVYQPLNNYLMFTDVMAAYPTNQSSCLNLLYDIAQLRKQKLKMSHHQEYQKQLGSMNNEEQRQFGLNNNNRNENSISLGKRIEQNAREIMLENSMFQQHSLNLKSFNKRYLSSNNNSMFMCNDEHYNQNSILNNNDDQYGSLAFHWNNYNSNMVSNNIIIKNNSSNNNNNDTKNNNKDDNDQQINNNNNKDPINKLSNQNSNNNQQQNNGNISKQQEQPQQYFSNNNNNCIGNKQQNNNNNNNDKLDHIRNYINMIQMQQQPINNTDQLVDNKPERQWNSLNSHNSMHKPITKQVKTISVIKKKTIIQ